MRRILIILVICNLFNYSSAQNRAGYLGKKNMISVFTTSNYMHLNLVNNFLADDGFPHYVHFKKDNTKKDRVQLFRIDYRVSYQRILSERFAIGVEYAYEKVKLNSYSFNFSANTSSINYTYYERYASPVFNANSFLLTFEFFKKNQITGQGFSVACGVGPKLYRFNDKQNYRIDESTPIDASEMFSPKLNYLAINAFYQMTYRHPINQFLSFEIGLRFHTGVVLRKNYNYDQDNVSLWGESTVYRQLVNMNGFNLASLKTGFVFTL